MDNQLQLQIDRLNKLIELENKDNPNKRRRFSKKLKNKIALFCKANSISTRQAAHHFNVGFSTLEKWNSNLKNRPNFKEVKITDPVVPNNSFNYSENFKRIQIFLIILIVLAIVETIFQSLIFWRN
jgi:transposase-like protein